MLYECITQRPVLPSQAGTQNGRIPTRMARPPLWYLLAPFALGTAAVLWFVQARDSNVVAQAVPQAALRQNANQATTHAAVKNTTATTETPVNPAPINPPTPTTNPTANLSNSKPSEPNCLSTPSGVVLPPPTLPKSISGRVGLFVARFSKGASFETPETMVFKNPEWQFPLASNYKQAVLFEVFRQVQAGKLKLSEKFDVTPQNESLGWYPFDGTNVIGLSERMMLLSDNTATDILHRRIGIGSLQPHTTPLGLCKTRLILPTKLWWTAEAGLGGQDFPKYALLSSSKRFADASFTEQLAIAKRLDIAAQKIKVDQLNPALETYFSGRNGSRKTIAEIDRNLQNASTPAEWARFLHHIYNAKIFAPNIDAQFRKIAWLGKGRAFLRVPFSNYAGKSGNTARVLTFSGMFSALSGDRLVYVYFNDASETETTRDQTKDAFDYINAALRLVMRSEDLVWPVKTKVVDNKNKIVKPTKNNLTTPSTKTKPVGTP